MNLLKKPSLVLFWFLVFCCFFLQHCKVDQGKSDPLSHIEDKEVKRLLTKVFKSSGGWDQWNGRRSLRFKKHFILYDSLGNTENEVLQKHRYAYRPKYDIDISWTKEGALHRLNYRDQKTVKTIDGEPDITAEPDALLNSVLSATFVMDIPFNLRDPGIAFTYLGRDILENGEEVEVLQAIFDSEEQDNHSTSDVWTYYFEKSTYQLLGYLVQHADHFSYVKNLTSQKLNGFIFPKTRKSWRVTPDREILYLRAAYEYSDFEMD